MRKSSRSSFGWLGVFVFLFILSYSFLSKTFVYAEESLGAFQQEVIVAKQKHEIIVAKMDAMQVAFDGEKSSLLSVEAQRLMQELTEKSAPQNQPEIQEDSKKEFVKEKKSSWISNVKNVFKKEEKKEAQKGKKDAFWSNFGYKEKALADGEAHYKVAVSDNKITLKEAVEIGVANNIQLLALKKKIEVAASKLTEAKRALFPTIQGVVEFNEGKAQGTDTNLGGRFYKGENQKININQPLFYGGELILTVKQAEENLKSSKAEYEKAKNELVHQVRASYYGVVKAEYNVQYQTELNEKSGVIYKRVKEEHREKVISEVDFLNVESQYHQVHFQAESAQNDLLSANLVFHQALNLESDLPLPVDLRLNFKPIELKFEEVLQMGLEYNAEIRIKEYAYLSAQYGVQIYKAKKLPRVDLRGSFGYLGEVFKDTQALFGTDRIPGTGDKDEDNADLDLEKEWFLGVKVSMPLGPNSIEYDNIKHVYGPTILALHGSEDQSHKVTFNLFDKLSDITDEKGAYATVLQSKSDFEKAKDELTVKIKDDFYSLQKSLIQIDSSMAKIRYQEKRNSISEYMVGIQETSVSAYLEGLIEQAQNKFSFIQAVTDYHIAASGLSVSMGDPYYFESES